MALRLGPALLVILSFTAIMVGLLFNAISIDELLYSNPPATHFETNVVISDQDTNLFWFLQITDLHLSAKAPSREKDLNEFATNYLKHIKPDAVLVTGDITDGRAMNGTFKSGPQLSEWVSYSNAITSSDAIKKTRWLDIRGNHDNFNVYRPADPNVLYRKYSNKGKDHARNYVEIIEKNGKNYTFIGVDEVQTPGLKIPFNFIGIVEDQDLTELRQFKDLARASNSQYTIWFAHYPTSSIASPNEGLRNIIDGPYLCGHFHTIGNLVTQMHATQQPGFAEVELGDWKENRRLRVASIDNQLFNFVDVAFNEFPIALMTNPKKAEHIMPKYEPVSRMSTSTHLRVIAFSNTTIKKVEISLDGGESSEMHRVDLNSPLYVHPWNPKDYATGYHKAEIFVEDIAGLRRSFVQSFALDGSKGEFSFGAKVLLRAYFKSYVMTMFYFLVTICTLPLIALRMIVYNHNEGSLKRHYRGTFLYNLHILCNVKVLFVLLVIIPIWMGIGPHFIGRMVDEAIGACFVWGVLIDGKFIHTGITFNVGSIFLTFIHIPEVSLLTYQVSNSYKSLRSTKKSARVFNFKFIIHIMLTAFQLLLASVLFEMAGWLALLTSFPFVWCAFIYNYCWYHCSSLTRADFETFSAEASDREEQQALTGQRNRDDKSSASDQSNC